MKILLTGFEPFGGESINPSWEAVKSLQGYRDLVDTLELPCTFDRCLQVLEDRVRTRAPDIILAVGQAGGRPSISLEKVAINLNEARIPDNAGEQPLGTPVVPDAPAAYFSQLPLKRLMATLQECGIPADLSYTAGTFVCNHLFYGASHLAQQLPQQPRVGFVHIPYLPEQAARHPGSPSMALATLCEAMRLICDALIAGGEEIDLITGTTH
ncbi:pyroglutamyl-peptidase I [Microbulbifer sp. CAU 1566]|uniref:pyroglutamyl-peptidase I n=1 Tax=Microbulbifer sp. CAU 1566 TaxID=2933269 RepID=UPI00200651C3|nr:pyroglutamyl-peptidase I [Microbulbifer sp. CAU 1566]